MGSIPLYTGMFDAVLCDLSGLYLKPDSARATFRGLVLTFKRSLGADEVRHIEGILAGRRLSVQQEFPLESEYLVTCDGLLNGEWVED